MPVVTSAPLVLVRDVGSGTVLFARHMQTAQPIASLTKLMTALVLVQDTRWNPDAPATVLAEDVTEGGRWYLRFGDPVRRADLLSVMLVASGNNETEALVRLSGKERAAFVAEMNAEAARLGMGQTHFEDPVGLSPLNTSTPEDVAVLLDRALAHPELAARLGRASMRVVSDAGQEYMIDSTDSLFHSFLNLAPWKITGGKTGTLDEAGACLAVRVEREGRVLDLIVLGAATPTERFADVKALATWVWEVYRWRD